LAGCVANPLERDGIEGQALHPREGAGEERGWVEAAFAKSPPMKGHGDHEVDARAWRDVSCPLHEPLRDSGGGGVEIPEPGSGVLESADPHLGVASEGNRRETGV
jgi:hypothetical protein